MSSDHIFCPECGAEADEDASFCGDCAAAFVPRGEEEAQIDDVDRVLASLESMDDDAAEEEVVDDDGLSPETRERFLTFVRRTLREGVELGEIVDSLVDDAATMGISQHDALDIIESVRDEASSEPATLVRLFYDSEQAMAGVANGNTVLAVRVMNTSSRNIGNCSVHIQHPLTREWIDLPDIAGLATASAKETEADLLFSRVGRQSVRSGFLIVELLTSEKQVYRFSDSIRLNAENSDSARATVHSISQTIQTHGGGVVSADGVASIGGPQTSADPLSRWEEIRLTEATLSEYEVATAPEVSGLDTADQNEAASERPADEAQAPTQVNITLHPSVAAQLDPRPAPVPDPPKVVRTGNIGGALAYVLGPISGLLFLLFEKEQRFVRFHAAQSLLFSGVWVVFSIVLSLLPPSGLSDTILFGGSLVWIGLWIAAMVQAAAGKLWELPVIGSYARRMVNQDADLDH